MGGKAKRNRVQTFFHQFFCVLKQFEAVENHLKSSFARQGKLFFGKIVDNVVQVIEFVLKPPFYRSFTFSMSTHLNDVLKIARGMSLKLAAITTIA